MSDQTTSADSTIVPATAAPSLETTLQQKRMALGLISGCHVLNHLQYSITAVIFPVMMTELGFGPVGLGFISALSSFVGQGLHRLLRLADQLGEPLVRAEVDRAGALQQPAEAGSDLQSHDSATYSLGVSFRTSGRRVRGSSCTAWSW